MASWANGTTVLGGPMKFILLCHQNFCPENFGLLHGTKWKIGLDQVFREKKIHPLAWATHGCCAHSS